jgi:hypothetical protein
MKIFLSALCALSLVACAHSQRDLGTGGAGEPTDQERGGTPDYVERAQEGRQGAPTVYDDQPHGIGGSPEVTTEDEQPKTWKTRPDATPHSGPSLPDDGAQGGAATEGSQVFEEDEAEGGAGEQGLEFELDEEDLDQNGQPRQRRPLRPAPNDETRM